MKIAVILGPFSVGSRPLDFNHHNIWESSRGLTGTDLTTVMISIEFAKKGHDTHLFTFHSEPYNKPNIWENIKLYNFGEYMSVIDNSFDVVLSINEPNVLMGIQADKPIRVCWQFLNDFKYCEEGFDGYVDQWLGVCQQHIDFLTPQLTHVGNWQVLGLGCSPEWYQDQRIAGRVVWCSSADRGLHWLLQEWPKIKNAVPEATLKIFYHFGFEHIQEVEHYHSVPNHIKEMGYRVRYMKDAIERLKPLGVEHVGSVSRNRLRQELNEASVFGFSCDTVSFSEGFSVATLEAHASFTVPIITDKDCLGSVYKNSGALVVKTPLKDRASEYSDLVIKALKDKQFNDHIVNQCREFALQNSWEIITNKLECIIKEHPKYKGK